MKVSIVIPTYNERGNVQPLCEGIRKALEAVWEYEVIIVDDSSPDGTSEMVRHLAVEDPRIKLIQRQGKLGLGSAVTAGFAVAKGEYWVMMDADLSHRPEDLPKLLKGLSDADIVVGSRYVQGGGVVNWPLPRRIVSRGASALGRWIVGLQVRDLTSGFGAFRRDRMVALMPSLNPKGFKLLLEILAKSRDARVKETPITFVDRRHGRSKASAREALLFFRLCFELRGQRNGQGRAST
ncbi:MAG: polyprenol monophosphomannose synthase [Chloroflexi bacterium]|nr:polyprenol monophosphomannose synthase [Chloroflexota bacterium]